jgi:predicted ATPase/class 3 adenylate cyclase
MTNHTEQIAQLKAAIEALETQRSILGDAVVDLSLKTLNKQIAELETASTTATPSKGERRQATILFSDLSGYTSMNEKLDPEKVQELMGRIKLEAVRIVEHHGGIVNQFVGDEVLALFGIPHAHEDDPVRAVKAALELHEIVHEMSAEVEGLIGRPLTMHSGINTGLIVTTVKDDRDGKFGLTGDAVNTGARLVAQAKGNEILVSPQTQALIAPYFRTESLEPVMMKGKAAPIVPYRILGKTAIQNRLEASEARGFTPYVGREEELATLHSCLEKTICGEGQFVTVRGAAGLGKSRLLYEFRHQLDRQKITVLQGRCQSYGGYTPYLPFLDALRRGLHLRDEDSPSELHEKAVNNLRKIDPALEKYIPVFLHLLSIPSEEFPLAEGLSGEQLKLSIQEAIVSINTLNTRHKPMVLILEDWHWADEGSDAVLLRHLDVMASFPLMIVLLFRPEYAPKWGSLSCHSPIDLSSVDEKGMESMIKAIYGVEEFPKQFALQIFNHSAGNPFFIEELCSLLRQEGSVLIEEGKLRLPQVMEQISFPQTVQAVIRAKLDRLGPEQKEVMRLASVIGREFLQRILEQIITRKEALSPSLENLKRIDFIRQMENLPELTYQFNHVITQEVTYQTLLIRQRSLLHRLVARTIEVLYAERLEEQFEVLAHHYGKSEDWEKALYYQEMAGDKAARNFSLLDARTYYRKALKLIDSQQKIMDEKPFGLKARRIEISLKWAKISHYAWTEDSIQVLETSLAFAREMSNKSKIAHLTYWLGQRNYVSGNLKQAMEHFSNCIEFAEQSNEKALLAQAYAAMGRINFFGAEYLKAEDFFKKSLPLLEELGEVDDVAYVKGTLSMAYTFVGDFEKAFGFAEKAIKISEETGNLSRLAFFHAISGMSFFFQGNWEKGIEASNQCIKIARPIGDVVTLFGGLLGSGYSLFMNGSKDEGLLKMQQGFEMMKANQFYLYYPAFYSLLAHCFVRKGKLEEAIDMAKKCLEWSPKAWKGWESLAYFDLAMAEAPKKHADPKKVDQTMEKGLSLCRERGQGPHLAQGYFEYANILFDRGDLYKAQNYLEQAIALFSEMNMPWWLEQARELEKR